MIKNPTQGWEFFNILYIPLLNKIGGSAALNCYFDEDWGFLFEGLKTHLD